MNKSLQAWVAGSFVAASALAAQTALAEVSANMAFTTDYVFRGVSQTDSAPAIQGGFDFAHESGLYAGLWASSVDETVGPAGLEYDLYGGYGGELANGMGYDLGVINYRYPGGDSGGSADASEFYAGATYAGLGATYYVGDSDLDADYLDLSYAMDLAQGFGLGLHVGSTMPGEGDDVMDYGLSVSKGYGGYDLSLNVTDTDIDNPNDAQDSRLFLTVSKSL